MDATRGARAEIPTGSWRTTILVILAIALLIAEAAWIYTPLGDLELTPTIRIGLTVCAALVVALAGLSAANHERRLSNKEKELRQSLADSDAARHGLFETIAQDIDARLTPIAKSAAGLLRDDKLAGTQRTEVQIISYNTERLQRFAADIRDVIRIGQGKLSLQLGKIDLRDVVIEAVRTMSSLAKHYGVDLRTHGETSLPIKGDPQRLVQVLQYLIRNAINFSLPGGRVLVISGVHENHARITVQDTGRGLSESEIASLFRLFGKAHRPGESREPGSGLGLVVAKGIIEAHDGRIWAESPGPRKGSSFLFEIRLDARPFDIRNAPAPASGAPQLPPALEKAEREVTH